MNDPIGSSSNPAESRPFVLVADDDELARRIVAKILEKLGCHVDAVSDGAEAVEAARTVQYDLIILDGVMPEMDGLEAARQIRLMEGERGRVPIVGVTGDTVRITKEKCREAGMNHYLQKPVGREAYRNVVKQFIRQQHDQ